MRLDASTEKVNISKEVKFENDVQLNVSQNIKWTNVFIREIQGTTRPEFDLIVNGSTAHMRMWVAGAIKLALTNTAIACKVPIDAEQGLTVFNGQQLKSNIINSNTNSNLVLQRDRSTTITLKAGNEVDFSGYVNINNISTENDTDMAIRRNDIEFIRLFEDGITFAEAIFCYKQLRATEGFKTNTIGSDGNNTLNIQQNDNTFISLQSDALNRVQINRFLRVVDGGGSTQAQFVESTNGNYMEIRLGNHINAYVSGSPPNGNTLHINYYSHGNVMLGTTLDTTPDPTPTISINKFSSGTGNAFEVQGNSVFSGTVSTNTLNSENGDLVFERVGTEFMRFQGSDFTIRMIYSVISTNTYIDNHRPTAFGVDTFFYGNNSTDNGYIEYFRFNHANQRCDYFVNIN